MEDIFKKGREALEDIKSLALARAMYYPEESQGVFKTREKRRNEHDLQSDENGEEEREISDKVVDYDNNSEKGILIKKAINDLALKGFTKYKGKEYCMTESLGEPRVVARIYQGGKKTLMGVQAITDFYDLIGERDISYWIPEEIFKKWSIVWRAMIENLMVGTLLIRRNWYKLSREGELLVTRDKESYERVNEPSLMQLKKILLVFDCPLDVGFVKRDLDIRKVRYESIVRRLDAVSLMGECDVSSALSSELIVPLKQEVVLTVDTPAIFKENVLSMNVEIVCGGQVMEKIELPSERLNNLLEERVEVPLKMSISDQTVVRWRVKGNTILSMCYKEDRIVYEEGTERNSSYSEYGKYLDIYDNNLDCRRKNNRSKLKRRNDGFVEYKIENVKERDWEDDLREEKRTSLALLFKIEEKKRDAF